MKLFVNLPVKDLAKSREFYAKLGFTINEEFSDETAACVVLSDEIYVMLLTHPKFSGFTKKEITDSSKNAEVINALTVTNRESVDEMLEKALAAGGKEYRDPEEHDHMYGRSFEDPDGHMWEVFYMKVYA